MQKKSGIQPRPLAQEATRTGKVLLGGHRGAGMYFPGIPDESYVPANSLAALEKASDLGADVVEIDLRLTKNNQAVVFHDKTANGCAFPVKGEPEELKHLMTYPAIRDLTFEQLSKYCLHDFGYYSDAAGSSFCFDTMNLAEIRGLPRKTRNAVLTEKLKNLTNSPESYSIPCLEAVLAKLLVINKKRAANGLEPLILNLDVKDKEAAYQIAKVIMSFYSSLSPQELTYLPLNKLVFLADEAVIETLKKVFASCPLTADSLSKTDLEFSSIKYTLALESLDQISRLGLKAPNINGFDLAADKNFCAQLRSGGFDFGQISGTMLLVMLPEDASHTMPDIIFSLREVALQNNITVVLKTDRIAEIACYLDAKAPIGASLLRVDSSKSTKP